MPSYSRHLRARAAVAAVLAIVAAPRLSAQAAAAPDTTLRVAFGAFVDSYVAYDFGRPATLDRSFGGGATFTTQPARHDEFNVNLAHVEAVLSAPRLRGRLALQVGTSVQSNYAAEPAQGSVSGASLSRHIQEAYAGYRVAPTLWVDGGVFFSHMGMESWISRDNPTYTRSLVAEYSPYYSSGVRAVWQVTPALVAHLHVVNGWQNISETNTDKGAGIRLDVAPSSAISLSYYNFVNGETGGRLRVFNGAGAKWTPSPRTTVVAQADYGTLERAGDDGRSRWWGFTLVGRQRIVERVALAARVERFDDPDQVNISTGLDIPFVGNGASLGLDVAPHQKLLWRSELRGFAAKDRVFPDPDADATLSKRNALVVTSLALTF